MRTPGIVTIAIFVSLAVAGCSGDLDDENPWDLDEPALIDPTEPAATVGTRPLQRPELWFQTRQGDWTIDLPGRGAGTCTMSNGGYYGGDDPQTIVFNDRGQPTSFSDGEDVVLEYRYDEDGWLTEAVRPHQIIVYERNEDHRVTRITYLHDRGLPEREVSLDYDELGRLALVTEQPLEAESDVEYRETPVNWSNDGRTRTDAFWGQCGEPETTLTFDAADKLVGHSTFCEAFGAALREFEREEGRYLKSWNVDRMTGEKRLSSDVQYDEDGRPITVRRGSWALGDTFESGAQDGRSAVTWGPLGVTHIAFGLDHGRVLLETAFEGDCMLSVHDIRYNFTAVGGTLPHE